LVLKSQTDVFFCICNFKTPCNAVLEQPQNLHEAIAAASDSSIGI
jgi:hypothetical protein